MNIKQKHKFREGDLVVYHGQLGKVRCLSVGWLGWIEKRKEIVYIDLDGKLSKPYPNRGKFDLGLTEDEEKELLKKEIDSLPFNPSNRYSSRKK